MRSTTRAWAIEDFDGIKAPTTLDGASVRIGGQNAFLSYISPSLLTAQVPSTLTAGSQPLTVTTPAGVSPPYSLDLRSVLPALLAPVSFSVRSAIRRRAVPGQRHVCSAPDAIPEYLPAVPVCNVLSLFGIGFGAVSPLTPAGQVVSQLNALTPTIHTELRPGPRHDSVFRALRPI